MGCNYNIVKEGNYYMIQVFLRKWNSLESESMYDNLEEAKKEKEELKKFPKIQVKLFEIAVREIK